MRGTPPGHQGAAPVPAGLTPCHPPEIVRDTRHKAIPPTRGAGCGGGRSRRMARKTIGKLPPRYAFLLNPYSDVRLSKCPKCDRPTHPRKFALMIHVDGWGPFVLGKTCRYCTPCELIIAHRDELEAELTGSFARLDPGVIGKEHLVIGT